MKTLLSIGILCLSFTLCAQIGAKVQQQGKVYGIWQNSEFGYQMTLILNADGKGEFDGEAISFSTQANKLSISAAGESTDYTYNLQGNSLILSGGDLEKPVTFSRSGGTSSTTQQTTTVNTTTTRPPVGATSEVKNLLGVWSGNGETIEFKSDGNCIYLGNSFPYEVSQGHVTLTSGQGKAMFAYAISGTQLTLTANGQQVIYNRGAGNNQQQNAISRGNIASELVGKWCYVNVTSTNSGGTSTDECITLNGDGTYVYYSERSMSVNTDAFAGGTSSQNGDRGTWSVQGDRIYYNSQSQGQGSYRLEKRNHPKNVGDPMIVLDGRAFVTATYRQPWR